MEKGRQEGRLDEVSRQTWGREGRKEVKKDGRKERGIEILQSAGVGRLVVAPACAMVTLPKGTSQTQNICL